MKSMKICILPIIASILLLMAATPLVSADETNVIDDPEDDVIISSADEMLEPGSTFETTSEKPNVDITKVTYFYSEQDDTITLTLEVKGSIEDKNDFDMDNPNATDFTGSMIQYSLLLEMSNNSHEIQYVDQNCTVDGEPTDDFTVSGSSLSVTFDNINAGETYVACYGYTMQFDIVSLTNMQLYMDIAPDEAFFIAYAEGPSSGEVGEVITFEGSYEDLLSISASPYTYTWNFDDGSSEETGSTVTHSFEYAGSYTVELTIEDGNGNQATAETTITISEESTNNGNGNNGNTGGDEPEDGEGSQVLLFVGVVVVIIIIGVVALLFVIRR